MLRQLFCGTCRNAVPRFTLPSQTKGGRRGGKGEVVATDQRGGTQQLMKTVQNKDNATRQMSDNNVLQVREGCCLWVLANGKCYRGHGRRSWDSGETNSMTEASARADAVKGEVSESDVAQDMVGMVARVRF